MINTAARLAALAPKQPFQGQTGFLLLLCGNLTYKPQFASNDCCPYV